MEPQSHWSSALAAVVGLSVLVAGRFGRQPIPLIAGPVGAVLMLLLARLAGLGADDLGLARRTWRHGALYAGVCGAVVAAAYTVAAVLPTTRRRSSTSGTGPTSAPRRTPRSS